jgi:hypothetical protein
LSSVLAPPSFKNAGEKSLSMVIISDGEGGGRLTAKPRRGRHDP